MTSLCGIYWYPLYAYVRRQGCTADEAQDHTQAFFLCFLEKDYLKQVDRERGRFRSFLLAALKHFLADERDRANALKRGGTQTIVSLDELRDAEKRYALEPAKGLTPEQIYERRWTLTVLDQVLRKLQNDYARSDKSKLFDRLKGFLTGGNHQDSHAIAAGDLDMTEGAVKVAVHRMRQRYGQLLESEIAETVTSADAIEDEIRYLFNALGAKAE